MKFKLEQIDPTSEAAKGIADGLAHYNLHRLGSRDLLPLCLAARNSEGEVIGGLLAITIWGWLLIERFWVTETARGQGLGSALLQQAEFDALARGCHHATLETFSFQSLPFYVRQGYEVYGQLDDFPLGQSRYSLRKQLGAYTGSDSVGRGTDQVRNVMTGNDAPEAVYLALLHSTTLDMLDRRDFSELLQVIVDRAGEILEAELAELMLLEGDELVTVACSRNQSQVLGDRVRRGQSLLSWRALDSGLPALIDDYSTWPGRRDIYNANPVHGVADFPIRIGSQSIGVLAMGRTLPDRPFTPAEVSLGMRFSMLAALVIDNARRDERVRNELAQRQAAEVILRQQNSELDAYARTVAHDLKIPLTTLIGMSRLLQAGNAMPEAARQQAIDAIYRTSLKMNQIIEALLSLSQQRLNHPAKLTSCEPSLIAHEASERLANRIVETGATVRIEPDLPAVQAHGPWLEEVFANLLSNAIKYGGKPPRIEIGGLRLGKQVQLWVRDHGPGIPESAQSQLFREFSRLDDNAVDIEGHGLGLSIVKRLVEAMMGQVGFDNPPDGGARFTMLLNAAS